MYFKKKERTKDVPSFKKKGFMNRKPKGAAQKNTERFEERSQKSAEFLKTNESATKRTKSMLGDREDLGPMRLNKFISDAGFCSRRKADELIQSGKITVNGKVAVPGMKVTRNDEVMMGLLRIELDEELVLIAYNKPEGIECTTNRSVPNNIVDVIHIEKRIYPVGRLDKDSTGLILLTNDGSIVNKMMKASTFHEKEYVVAVNKSINWNFISKMREGVTITQFDKDKKKFRVTTRPCQVEQIGDKLFKIILTQGYNRQIRRMCEELGYRVKGLKRTRIMNIELGNLEPGMYRNVTDEEIKGILAEINS